MNNIIQTIRAAISPTTDRLGLPASISPAQPGNHGPLPDDLMPAGLRPSPAPARVPLAPIDAQIAGAQADLDAGADRYREAQGELTALRIAIAALSAQPQPADYATPKAWGAATDAWHFEHARLSAGVPTLEQAASDAARALPEPTARMAELNLLRRKALCENALADMNEGGRAFFAQVHAYLAALNALDGPERAGLNIADKRGVVRSVAYTAFGDTDRIEATFVIPSR